MRGALVTAAARLLEQLRQAWPRDRRPPRPSAGKGESRPFAGPPPAAYRPLCRVTLTDEVGRTLFEEYAAHRRGDRGEEETGWVLLGLRQEDEAVVLATLPAGTQPDSGVAHVR